MIGIVVVSHSQALAEATVDLASEMVAEDKRPKIAIAAGLDENTFGTDAMAIMDAINEVDSPEGVLVMVDLGSAILSAETALEFLDDDVVERVKITAAPLVEGLIAALVTASTGASLDECDAEARSGLDAKREHLGVSEPVAETADSDQLDEEAAIFTTTILNPNGLHARPAANLVSELRGLDAKILVQNETTGKGPAPASSLNKIAALGLRKGDVMKVMVSGPDEAKTLEILARLAEDNFGEEIEPAKKPVTVAPTKSSGDQIVIGTAHVVKQDLDLSSYQCGSAEEESSRLRAAVVTVGDRLAELKAATPDQEGIFAAQEALLDDPDLLEKIDEDISSGQSAIAAVQSRFDESASDFESLDDPYLKERAQDVRSIQRALLAAVAGLEIPQLVTQESSVLIIEELDAAQASQLDPETCLGVITLSGGTTGHGAIVASSRGIPVVAGIAEAANLKEGDQVAFDPRTKEFWANPSKEQLEFLQQRAKARETEAEEALALAKEPAITSAGTVIKVEANVASEQDAANGFASGAEGSGLVRTEILFDGPTAPTAYEQAEVLSRIGDYLGGEMITVRTWDVGGDKPLPFLAQAKEDNPFLGERGVRSMPRVPELFREQLKAVLLAAAHTPTRVMFPMVTEPEELVWAKSQLDLARQELGVDTQIEVGMMVEVPAAALRIDEFVPLVDFVSIGTNDLTQYTTASDRTNAAVAHLAKSSSPGILKLIQMTCEGMGEKPVAVCGDLASDPTMTKTLVELGVRELSVRPPLVALIKQAVRAI